NASLYDGASAAAEAVLMAQRLNNRRRVLVARSVHPQYRQTIVTYTRNLGLTVDEVGFGPDGRVDGAALSAKLGPDVCGIVLQSPNFFGVIEDIEMAAGLAEASKAVLIAVVAEALSLGILEAPGKLGADIVCGEGQSFGLAPAFGGPSLGFLACAKETLRQLPGRIVGQTRDVDGRRGFVLTLSTREQHIRREKATSNICTNQAWCALRATIFLETLGQDGLREMALQNMHKARFALDRLTRIPGVKRLFSGPVFNEFVLELPRDAAAAAESLKARSILGGIALAEFDPGLKNGLLVCVTELQTRATIERLASALEEVLR
ncbi:MAG: aminomethyl-transferring glycine dehydrogenase subunit GcvPA, partial [Candidatus Aminicenantes bacterium]|nr:aminomethyl-transferring glycine dehydrogenase subunit GcvPA [Candidatus Aminicenantes bacterium]